MKLSFIPDYYRKISIKTKLMFIAIMFMIYPIVIIGYFGYRNYADTMKEKAVRDMQSSASELTELLTDRMTKLSLYAVQILYDNTIYDASRSLDDGSMDYIAENKFTNYLQSTLFLKSELDEILIRFTKDGRIFQVNKSMGSTTDSQAHIDELYTQAQKGRGSPVWYVTYDGGKATGIYITKIIYDINDIKKEIGLLVFKVDEQYLTEVINNYMTNTRQNVSLFNSDGREVFVSEPIRISYGSSLDKLIESGSDTGLYNLKVGNDTVYLIYDTIPPDDWKLVMGISSNILLKDVRDIAKFILILCAATLPICILLVNFLYSDIIRPMNLLIRRMRQVEKGDFGITIENRRSDEFGFVYGTFNKMSLEIRKLINTVYKKQIATKDAEIKALQAQINPHFLYNTLDSINWKAKIHGVDEISEMVSALSSIIEANMNRNNENLITLRNEIEYINNYYLLLKKRFGRKINMEMNIREDTLDCVIPKLIIQPIVENAVHHGLETKIGSGTINLNVHRTEGRILIEVTDDGTGIDGDTLNELRKNLVEPLDAEDGKNITVSSGIGIINVHKRIRLLYGEDYGLEISSRPGEGTSVTISMPAILPEGVEKLDKSSDNR